MLTVESSPLPCWPTDYCTSACADEPHIKVPSLDYPPSIPRPDRSWLEDLTCCAAVAGECCMASRRSFILGAGGGRHYAWSSGTYGLPPSTCQGDLQGRVGLDSPWGRLKATKWPAPFLFLTIAWRCIRVVTGQLSSAECAMTTLVV